MADDDNDSDHTDGEYVDTIDTLDQQPPRYNKYNIRNGNISHHHVMRTKALSSSSNTRAISDDAEYLDTLDTLDQQQPSRNKHPNGITTTLIDAEIVKAVQTLRNDLDALRHQLHRLEQRLVYGGGGGGVGDGEVVQTTITTRPFGISRNLLLFIVAWPFIANLIAHCMRTRHTCCRK